MTTDPVERRPEDEDDLVIEPDETVTDETGADTVVDEEAAATVEDVHPDDPDVEAIVDETRAPNRPGAG